ncbi:hypothetical protein DL96DRAFT_1627250, partial [Flagelloscypha sp. PMI_526]
MKADCCHWRDPETAFSFERSKAENVSHALSWHFFGFIPFRFLAMATIHSPLLWSPPAPILKSILEHCIPESPSHFCLTLLTLSRSTYDWLLPLLYHTLEFSDEGGFPAGSIDRQKLCASASPKCLALVRRVRCHYYPQEFSFSHFPNLTHLAFWGDQSIQPSSASALLELNLEEIFIWSENDNAQLLSQLSVSPAECRARSTLRRYSCYSQRAELPNQNWLHLQNITHILIICDDAKQLKNQVIQQVLSRQSLVCCVFIFMGIMRGVDPLDKETIDDLRDSRVVRLVKWPKALADQTINPYLWEDMAMTWKQIEVEIANNLNYQKTTTIDLL